MKIGKTSPTASLKEFKPFALLGEKAKTKIIRSTELSPFKNSKSKGSSFLPKIRISSTLQKKHSTFEIASAKMQNRIISKYQLKFKFKFISDHLVAD